MPEKFIWDSGEKVNVALTSALAYPELKFGVKRDRIVFTSAMVANQAVGDLAFTENETFLNVSFTPEQSGFAIVAMSSKPRAGEIEPEGASDYFDEIGASEAVKQAFDALPGDPPLHRSYSKHTKTFFCIQTCSTGREASFNPVGQTLEFLATKDANRFVLLRDGKPLAGQKVSMVFPGTETQELITDKNGRVDVDASGLGVVMLLAVWITMPEQANGVYHSDYATLTVDLGGAP